MSTKSEKELLQYLAKELAKNLKTEKDLSALSLSDNMENLEGKVIMCS